MTFLMIFTGNGEDSWEGKARGVGNIGIIV